MGEMIKIKNMYMDMINFKKLFFKLYVKDICVNKISFGDIKLLVME